MINGVLVERTVKEVKPALQTNSEGLRKVLEDLVKQYKRQQDEMERWKASKHWSMGVVTADVLQSQKKNNIQVVQQ